MFSYRWKISQGKTSERVVVVRVRVTSYANFTRKYFQSTLKVVLDSKWDRSAKVVAWLTLKMNTNDGKKFSMILNFTRAAVERQRIFRLGQRVKSDSHDTPNMLMRSAARRTRASVPYLIPFKYNSNAFDRVHLSLLLYIRCNVTFAIVLEILFYSRARDARFCSKSASVDTTMCVDA